MGCYWPDVTNVYFAGPIAIQATTVSVVSVLVKTTSQPSLVLFSVPTPRTFWPGTPETGVNETIACSLNGFGKVKCFVVGILALGVIFILPACIIKPPKAEFCTRLLSGTMIPERRRFMDARMEILENVLQAVAGIIPETALAGLESALCAELEKYEVQERTTEMVIRDGTAEGLLRKFLATKRIEGKAESTIEYYRQQLTMFLHNVGKLLPEITTFDLRFYLSAYKEKRKVRNRTLDNIRKCLSTFFTWLADEEFIQRNPCRGLKSIKYRKVMKKAFSQEELEKLKSACENYRDLALVGFLYSTGCRVSEAISINRNSLDLEKRELNVVGKGDKERTVYLTEVAVMYLRLYLSGRQDESPALFIGRSGGRLTKNGVETALKRIGLRAGVENVHPHRFRRTLATNMIARGASLQDVQAILGHEDIRTTQVYVYTNQRNVKNSHEKYAA